MQISIQLMEDVNLKSDGNFRKPLIFLESDHTLGKVDIAVVWCLLY